MPLLHWKTVLATALCAVACSKLGLAQAAPSTILAIEIENYVNYFNDITDYSKLATDPNRTTLAVQPRNFAVSFGIADIVSVNGTPVKGVFTERQTQLNHAVNPIGGQAIADAVRNNLNERHYEILKPDGTQIGSIMTIGPGGGNPPPGAPAAIVGANFIVVGGTGAFLGARGQGGGTQDPRPGPRSASMSEDPAYRRISGGGLRRFVIQLIPMTRPEVAITSSGPVVFHSDFSPVTVAKPAKAGEVLIVKATGLGPTVPGVDPGQPFPTDAIMQVTSPVAVTVNGQAADLVNSIGWPGLVDTYRVDFRVPDGTPAGMAAIQLTAAWIAGPSVNIAVQ